MASTASGWQYAVPTDTLVAWPAVSQAVADKLEIAVGGKNVGLVHISTSTLSGNANLQLNNVFTSAFTNYRIVAELTTSANVRIYFKTSESATPSGTYGYNNAFFSNTTVYDRNSAISSIRLTTLLTAGTAATHSIDVFSPQLNVPTKIQGQYFTFLETGLISGSRTVATQSDGFFLDLDSGTMSGTVRVYGYRNS
jgi:hypothetical protein